MYLYYTILNNSFSPTADAPDSEAKTMTAEATENRYDMLAREMMEAPPEGRILYDMEAMRARFAPELSDSNSKPDNEIRAAMFQAGAWYTKRRIRLNKDPNDQGKRLWVVGPDIELWKKAPNGDYRTEWANFIQRDSNGFHVNSGKPAKATRNNVVELSSRR